ncbi:MAG TPA: topoisomerase DNA-binding C4 zinc finger domain-containing protein, partial [Thermodesulfobacteriota bacterium]|nr:topoisomerase DNA-binding C4 zinc finger domain-containing protein [Thermodesulfobacteriota bacterium]
SKRLDKAEISMRSLRREGMPTDIECQECGAPMIIKWGKRGEFLSCSRYPDCKNAKQFEYGSNGEIKVIERKELEIRYDVPCDLCGRPMAVRRSRYGRFLGCTGYPECKNIKRMKDIESDLKESKEWEAEEKKDLKRRSFKKSGGHKEGLKEDKARLKKVGSR